MIKLLNNIIYSAFLFILFNCSSSQNQIKPDLNFNLGKINVWVDFMPGSIHSFHITGELNVNNSDTSAISNLNLDSLYVYQDGKILYNLEADFSEIKNPNETDLKSFDSGNYSFETKNELKLIKELDLLKTINIELILHSGSKKYFIKSEEIKIEKVY